VEFLLWLVIIAVVVGGGAYVWRNRTRLLARALGQPESRVQRHIDRPRD
jgi:uncharacterized iron-regulated membrane protein